MKATLINPADIPALADARSSVYRFLIDALDQPTHPQHQWLVDPEFAVALTNLCTQFAVSPPTGELFPAGYADHEARYIAAFEVGLPAPPVVLLASHYHRTEPPPRIIHEHVLIYRRFGVVTAPGNGQPPDHLLNELAFLARLDELLARGASPDADESAGPRNDDASVLFARRDFLARHVGRWTPLAAARAAEKNQPPVYVALLQLAAAATAQDLELTEGMIARLEERA
ncbi:MAG: hypothetical protein BIFFINMI_02131 [Phycisphaerae bacterium]|nr:hypothetical protein [Phycisphaerae bacterium]